jgi:hypothetical protein
MSDPYEQHRRARQVKVTLSEQQMEILDHYCRTFGLRRAYVVRHFLIGELADWYAKVMRPEMERGANQ